MKETLLRKLTSRKFWLAVVGFVGSIAVILGRPELSAQQAGVIATGIATLAAYVIGEGIADSSGKSDSNKSYENKSDSNKTDASGKS